MTWYLWLTIGLAAGSIYGSVMTHRLSRRRDRKAGRP